MSSEVVTPSQARSTARELFLLLHREQGDWFDLAWETFVERPRSTEVTQVWTTVPGLGATGGQDAASRKMAADFGMFAATFLIESAQARHELLARLELTSRERGLSKPVAAWIMEVAERLLGRPPQISSPTASIYVTELWDSRLSEGECCPDGEADARTVKQDYDIIVDEPTGFLRIRGETERYHDQIPLVAKMRRGMLWLALTNIGGCISHDRIAKLFGLGRNYDPNRIYQYPTELKKLVGQDLKAQMMGGGANGYYPINREGWSFCWLRQEPTPAKSQLLIGIGSESTSAG